jgi:hypothetical protein
MENRVLDYLIEKAPHDRSAKFVLKYGVAFKGGALPKIYRRGRIGACYRNSALMSLRHGLTYVEGFASTNINHLPTLHAWCIDLEGNVLDRTWGFTGENAYFGVPINSGYVKHMHKIAGIYSVIDLWELGWPIYAEDPASFLADCP